jgi:hypothetical protein
LVARRGAEATKLPSPSQARVVGPAELTVRRRCPVGSRTTWCGDAQRGSALHWRGLSFGTVRAVQQMDWQGTKLESGKYLESNKRKETGHSPNMRYSGPQLLSSWLHVASAEATKLPAPSQARAVGPAELTVRRRCPVGSRTTGVVDAQRASSSHWRGSSVRAVGETGPRLAQPADLEWFEHKQATRLTCATADPNCCHLGCTAQAP